MLFFLVGVLIRSYVFIDFFWLYLGGLAVVVVALLNWSAPQRRWLFLSSLCIVLGILRYQISLPETIPNSIWFYNDTYVTFEAIVVGEPDIRINHAKLLLSVERLRVNDQWQAAHGKVLASVNLYPVRRYGDRLTVDCQLKTPQAFKEFAYDRYLAKSDIYSLCYYPRITLLKQNNGNPALAAIFKFKNQMQLIINRNLPEPHASLFSGILLGSRRGIPELLNEQFNATSTSHLIAISGSHITIIAAVLMELLLAIGLWRRQAFWLVTVLLVIYTTLIGFPASAVRAALMGWLVLVATQIGRLSQSSTLILLAAVVMTAINPKLLRDDIGFQLSFVAVLGIIYVMPLFDRWLEKLPSIGGLKAVLSMTLATQLATLPLMVYYFGRFSLIGIVANLLVVWTFSYLLVGGFVALALSWLLPSLSLFFFWPLWLLLKYLTEVVALLAQLPHASLAI